MGELEAAQRHLTEALRRLESALARRLSAGGGGAGNGHAAAVGSPELSEIIAERNGLIDDVGELRHECERLQGALDEAVRDREQVRDAADGVARRLDTSIEELDRLLGD